MRILVCVSLIVAFFAAESDAQERRIEVFPAAPVAFAPVHARVYFDNCLGPSGVAFAHGRIEVTYRYLPPCDGVTGPVLRTVMLGRLPPGAWTVALVASDGTPLGDAPPPVDFVVSAGGRFIEPPTESAPNLAVVDLSGLWGIENRPSSGVTFSMRSDGLLAGLIFIYDEGAPAWYSLQFEPYTGRGVWEGNAYETRTSGDLYGPIPSLPPTYSDFDNVTLTYVDESNLTLCLTAGFQTTPPIPTPCYSLVRYPFD